MVFFFMEKIELVYITVVFSDSTETSKSLFIHSF